MAIIASTPGLAKPIVQRRPVLFTPFRGTAPGKSPSSNRWSAVRYRRSFSERGGFDHFFRDVDHCPQPSVVALLLGRAISSPVRSRKDRAGKLSFE
jgi:hypothetical protein